MKIRASRYHDFSAGHTVTGHKGFDAFGNEVECDGPCSGLHGHNYRVTFHIEADELDDLGRVVDFTVIKQKLCMWLEDNWDHRFLINKADPRLPALESMERQQAARYAEQGRDFRPSLVVCNFNPTAENMGAYLLNIVGPRQLQGTGAVLVRVEVQETRKCSAEVVL